MWYHKTFVCRKDSRAAAINRLAASALLDQPLGPTKMRLLLTFMDIPPLSRTTLQNEVDIVSSKVQEINNQEKRREVVGFNARAGASEPVHHRICSAKQTVLDWSIPKKRGGTKTLSAQAGTRAAQPTQNTSRCTRKEKWLTKLRRSSGSRKFMYASLLPWWSSGTQGAKCFI